jgi:DUF1365 family protein
MEYNFLLPNLIMEVIIITKAGATQHLKSCNVNLRGQTINAEPLSVVKYLVIRVVMPLCCVLVFGRVHFEAVRIQNKGLQRHMICLLEEDEFERS